MATLDDILYGDKYDLWKLSGESASKVIAEKIEEMRVLYQQVIAIADNADLRVSVSLEFPEHLTVGHNYHFRPEIAWNPSSKYC